MAAGGSGGGTPATVAELSDTHTHTQLHSGHRQTDTQKDRQTDIVFLYM